MKRLIVLAALAGLFGPSSARAAENRCVACHREAYSVPSLEHTFEEWAQSSHAKHGVTCEVCHGGDPSQAGKREAHFDLRTSTDPASKVYYTAIPETCGACHAAELAAFKASAHYRVLMKTGRGPDCLSCHGAMADTVIEPRYMEMTCTLCHRAPTQAYAARMAVEEAREGLRDLELASGHEDPALRARLRELLVSWHGFDAAKILTGARELSRDAAAARAALGKP